jgi:hypothetical protein
VEVIVPNNDKFIYAFQDEQEMEEFAQIINYDYDEDLMYLDDENDETIFTIKEKYENDEIFYNEGDIFLLDYL